MSVQEISFQASGYHDSTLFTQVLRYVLYLVGNSLCIQIYGNCKQSRVNSLHCKHCKVNSLHCMHTRSRFNMLQCKSWGVQLTLFTKGVALEIGRNKSCQKNWNNLAALKGGGWGGGGGGRGGGGGVFQRICPIAILRTSRMMSIKLSLMMLLLLHKS